MGVCFSQTSVTLAGDFAAIGVSGVSVTSEESARRESTVYNYIALNLTILCTGRLHLRQQDNLLEGEQQSTGRGEAGRSYSFPSPYELSTDTDESHARKKTLPPPPTPPKLEPR